MRKRWLVANFIEEKMKGAYWGIASRPASYELEARAGRLLRTR